MYAHVPYYTKLKSKRKFEIQNIKLSKISLPTVSMGHCICAAVETSHLAQASENS